MTQPIVFKSSLSIAALAFLRASAPAVISIGMLYWLASIFGEKFDDPFTMLAVLLALLAPVILQAPIASSAQLLARQWPSTMSLLGRWVVLLVVLLLIGYVTRFSSYFPRRVLLTWAVVTPAPLILVHLVLNETMRRVMNSAANVRRAVFAGCNDNSLRMAERLRNNAEICINVDGFFDDRSVERLGVPAEQRLLGGLPALAQYVKTNGIDVIFIALPMRHVQRVMDLLEDLRDTTASIYYVPDVFVFDLIQARTGEILGMPVMAMCETPFHGYRGVVKRLMDLSIGSLALLMLSPLLVLVAALIKATSSGPVIFTQRRYGLDGQEIMVYKFRTMTVTEDGDLIRQATRDDARITPLGRILRRYSIDELPQLFNVIGGSMSLVGPRPHAVAHNEQYRKLIKGYMIRHKVPPGITGLAQISGCRGETETLEQMQARIDYDLDYLRRWSPGLDLMIIAQTALLLLNDRRAY
jgi:putative colanic acid biosysnthesis UDP-glucose lipid carrier transferase